jgi:hypothetical protein
MSNTLELIAKLLAQGENAGTEEEAAVFTAKAQQIAAANSIDLAKARHLTISKQKTIPVQCTIIIGVKGTEGLATLVELYLGIAHANDIRCLICPSSTRVYAYGFAEDIDVSEAMYASLLTQMTVLVAEFKKRGDWKKETVWAKGWYSSRRQMEIPGRYKPISWRSARINFQAGFGQRIASRLAKARYEVEHTRVQKEETSHDTTEPGTAVVLASKRQAVDDLIAPGLKMARGSYKGSRDSARYSSSARASGYAAGGKAKIGSAAPLGGAKKAIGR